MYQVVPLRELPGQNANMPEFEEVLALMTKEMGRKIRDGEVVPKRLPSTDEHGLRRKKQSSRPKT